MKKIQLLTITGLFFLLCGCSLFGGESDPVVQSEIDKCSAIENSEQKQQCKNSVYFELATTKKDVEICKKLSRNSQISCEDSLLLEEVRNTGDAEICKKIQEEVSKGVCQDILKTIKKSPAIILESDEKKSQEISLLTEENPCDILETDEEKIICEDNILLTKALKILDSQVCEKISDEEIQKNCLEEIKILEQAVNFIPEEKLEENKEAEELIIEEIPEEKPAGFGETPTPEPTPANSPAEIIENPTLPTEEEKVEINPLEQ